MTLGRREHVEETKSKLDYRLRAVLASDPDAIADPFPVWNEVRATAAVFPLDEMVLIPRHADIAAILKDQRFASNAKGHGSQFDAIRARLRGDELRALDEVTAFEANYVSRSNGEAHARLRRIAQRAFAPPRIALMRERIQWHTNDLVDNLARGDNFNLKEVAYQLPLRIIGELLQIPQQDLERIHEWSEAIGRNRGGTETPALMAAHEALHEFKEYTDNLLAGLRRKERAGDEGLGIVNMLMDAEQEERLSATELTAMFVVLLFAGHETTTNLIASGSLQLLLTDQWSTLATDPTLIPNAVEELLRFVTPVQIIGRVTSGDLECAGQVISAGTTVYLLFAAGNRDPSVFREPDHLDIRRTDARKHIALGTGPHLCIGAQLARLEAVVALETLTTRFPKMQLAKTDLTWHGNVIFRTLTELPVRTGRRAE